MMCCHLQDLDSPFSCGDCDTVCQTFATCENRKCTCQGDLKDCDGKCVVSSLGSVSGRRILKGSSL
jgi:hypothetical protein